jgi:hypothetical protein
MYHVCSHSMVWLLACLAREQSSTRASFTKCVILNEKFSVRYVRRPSNKIYWPSKKSVCMIRATRTIWRRIYVLWDVIFSEIYCEIWDYIQDGPALLTRWVTRCRLYWPKSRLRPTRVTHWPRNFGPGQRPSRPTRPIPILTDGRWVHHD